MIRCITVSAVVLCGLLAAIEAEAKNPNIPNPQISLPRPPGANRIVVPRRIIAPLPDQTEDEQDSPVKKKKKATKKKAKKDVVTPAALTDQGLPVSDRLRDLILVFGGNADALAEIKEILEGLEEGDNGSFGGPLSEMFPGHQAADPYPQIPGTGGHTTGQHEDQDNPGDRLDEIIESVAGQGSGDNRGPDDGQSQNDPEDVFGKRTGSVGGMGVGGFDSGLPDPSGEASQDRRGQGWTNCGRGCSARWTDIRRGGRVVGHRFERRTHAGTRTETTRDGSGTTRVRFENAYEGYSSWSSVIHTSEDGQRQVEIRDYDDANVHDVIISRVVGANGAWEEVSRQDIPEVRQPAPDETATGGGPRGGAFYRLVCGGMVCTYTPLSREQIVVGIGPIQVNPGDAGNENAGQVNSGPRVGPGAVTDPDPENLGMGSGRRGPPVERGCGGMIQC
jgi:hypothetical protein